jgi:hypothetical protein
MVVSLAGISTIMPIISFLFVFILVYALLVKTNVLGDNKFVSLFISLIIASFFIVNVNLVDFTRMSISWFVVFIVCVFMILLVLGFMGKDALKVFTDNKTIAGVCVALVVIIFLISSMYTFNWAINWDLIQSWFDKDWFGMAILIVIAAAVAFVLTKKK